MAKFDWPDQPLIVNLNNEIKSKSEGSLYFLDFFLLKYASEMHFLVRSAYTFKFYRNIFHSRFFKVVFHLTKLSLRINIWKQ